MERIDYCLEITSDASDEISVRGLLCEDQHEEIGAHSIGGVIATYCKHSTEIQIAKISFFSSLHLRNN